MKMSGALLWLAILVWAISLALPGLTLLNTSIAVDKPSSVQVLYGIDILTFNARHTLVFGTQQFLQDPGYASLLYIIFFTLFSLIAGPIVLLVTPTAWAWYANPIALLAIVSSRKGNYIASVAYSLIAVGLGFVTFFYKGDTSGNYGNIQTVQSIDISFYVWEAALILCALYCITMFLESKESAPLRK